MLSQRVAIPDATARPYRRARGESNWKTVHQTDINVNVASFNLLITVASRLVRYFFTYKTNQPFTG